MKKYYLTIPALLFFPWQVWAATSWALKMENGKFSIQGSCEEKVNIELFEPTEKNKAVFSERIECQRGKFFFSEDLIKENLPVGNYAVSINGQKNPDMISVARNKNIKNENHSSEQKDDQRIEENFFAEETSNPEIKFFRAFAALQQALLDMRDWLTETSYPKVVKMAIDSGLNGIGEIIGKIEEALWSAEKDEEPADALLIENNPESFSREQEPVLFLENESNQKINSVEEILSASGLEILKKEKDEKSASE